MPRNLLSTTAIAVPLSEHGFPPFSTPRELAERLRRSVKTLADWRLSGEGPEYIKAGPRNVIYPAASIEEWLAKGRRLSTSGNHASA